MVETIKISELNLMIDPAPNDEMAVNDVSSDITKKLRLDDIAQVLDYQSSLSTDSNNYLKLGSDDKLYYNELPINYIDDDISYISTNRVSWQGRCRDSSNSRDFQLTATNVDLTGASPFTAYYLFIASNTIDGTPYLTWESTMAPALPYYRLLFSILTDSAGEILPFHAYCGYGKLDAYFQTRVQVYGGSSLTTGKLVLPVPAGNRIKVFLSNVCEDSDVVRYAYSNGDYPNNGVFYGATGALSDKAAGSLELFTDTSSRVEHADSSNLGVKETYLHGYCIVR